MRKAGDGAPFDQLEDEPVNLVEHHRIFHPQRRELIHVEESTVIDLFGCDAPVSEPVRLLRSAALSSGSKLRGWPAMPLSRRTLSLISAGDIVARRLEAASRRSRSPSRAARVVI